MISWIGFIVLVICCVKMIWIKINENVIMMFCFFINDVNFLLDLNVGVKRLMYFFCGEL